MQCNVNAHPLVCEKLHHVFSDIDSWICKIKLSFQAVAIFTHHEGTVEGHAVTW